MEQSVSAVQEPEPEKSTPEAEKALLVVLDPGHGGNDEGTSHGDIQEKDINLSLALSVKDRLEKLGYEVLLTRQGDTYVSPEDRIAFANDREADAFVSIHQNACEESSVTGIETWYTAQNLSGEPETLSRETENTDDLSDESRRLARLVHGQTVSQSKAKDREAKGGSEYIVTVNAHMPACLIETGFLSNETECAALNSKEYQDKLAAGIAEGIDLYFHPKIMYLTFDDGPSEENTGAVLDILKERGIHATFFVVGENVRKHPEVARRIVEEGHTIGIHCNVHKYKELYESVDSYLKDFQAAYEAVYEITGEKAVLFRFPGGSINAYNEEISQEIIEEMTELGFVYFDWNASLEDAVRGAAPEKLVENARKTALGRKKVVMLAHDIVYSTVLCLPQLLDEFPEYRMEALNLDVEPIQF